MILTLKRIYFPSGTNGELNCQNKKICETIELPWLNNQQGLSCIPEGRYDLEFRMSKSRGKHLWVKNVPGRSFILIHTANDAVTELRGCIAPVTKTTAPGKGVFSRKALEKILNLIVNEPEVTLIIES